MQHTEKYNFSLIDADDAFSPDALNANARQLEDQLARVEDGAAAEVARLETAAAAEQTRVNGEVARLDAAAAAEQARVNGEIARLDAAAAAEKTRVNGELTKLNTAIGTGGTTARIVTGSYKGTGTWGKSSPNKLDFSKTLGKAPKLLIVADSADIFRLVMVNGSTHASSYPGLNIADFTCVVTWSAAAVEWYCTYNNMNQMNSTHTYYYVAIA